MLGHPLHQYSPPRVGFPILRVPPSQLAFTHPPTHHPSPISFPPLQHQQSVTAPHRQCGRTREGRWMEGWMGKSDKAGSAQRGPGTITCPGSTCPLPAGPAHLDPAGLCSHLVYPPPALHANPLSRGAPHVGASGGHVSAPPQPRCQGRPAPPGHATAPGAMRRGVARPLPGCRVPGRALEGDTSVRQAEGKRARTAPTRGREGAAAAGRLRMEGRERLLHPGQERASSIGGAGPHRAPGPCALARRRIRETPPLRASVPGAGRGPGLPGV